MIKRIKEIKPVAYPCMLDVGNYKVTVLSAIRKDKNLQLIVLPSNYAKWANNLESDENGLITLIIKEKDIIITKKGIWFYLKSFSETKQRRNSEQ